jgi:hypothetical protein
MAKKDKKNRKSGLRTQGDEIFGLFLRFLTQTTFDSPHDPNCRYNCVATIDYDGR